MVAVQVRDTSGNLIQSQVYDYPTAGTLLRQYDFTYENGSNYVSRYIHHHLFAWRGWQFDLHKRNKRHRLGG